MWERCKPSSGDSVIRHFLPINQSTIIYFFFLRSLVGIFGELPEWIVFNKMLIWCVISTHWTPPQFMCMPSVPALLLEFSVGSNDADERGQSLTITEGTFLWKYWEDGLSGCLLRSTFSPYFFTYHTHYSVCLLQHSKLFHVVFYGCTISSNGKFICLVHHC